MEGQLFPELSVVIMAFNELQSISLTLESCTAWLNKHVQDWEIVVVDDGSKDGTDKLVSAWSAKEARVRLLRHPHNLGMGAAIASGYLASRKAWITQLPADGQVPPDELLAFLPKTNDYDLVLSVYDRRGDGFVRTVLSTGYSLMGRLILRGPSSFTGTMFIKRELLEGMEFQSKTFLLNLEIPLKLIKKGVPYGLVVFRPSPRLAGESKVAKPGRVFRVTKEMLRLRLNWKD